MFSRISFPHASSLEFENKRHLRSSWNIEKKAKPEDQKSEMIWYLRDLPAELLTNTPRHKPN